MCNVLTRGNYSELKSDVRFHWGGARAPLCTRKGRGISYGSEANPERKDHYIGIDVGTGSARACIVDSSGTIRAIATEEIKLWKPQVGYYVQTSPPLPSPSPPLDLTFPSLPPSLP